MIFRVKHTNPLRHRSLAVVTARNVDDCIAQVETALGEHIGLSVICMKARPVLRLCAALAPVPALAPAHFVGRVRHA